VSKARIFKDGEEASIRYLHNAIGQRVFKGEPTASQTLPSEADLGTSFIDWLKKNFRWLYANAQANTSIGTAYVYGDGEIPSWVLLGEYDNGSAKGAGRSEFIWLPTEDGSAIPIGMFRNGKLFAIHADHLGTPRLMTNDQNQPVWQWPYSAFGNNKPTGVLKAAPNPKAAITNVPVLLKATAATEMGLRMPGQVDDPETGTFYNAARQYWAMHGAFNQMDPIGVAGGLNRRGYVNGDPLRFSDPRGTCPVLALPIILGSGITLGDFAIGAGIAAGAALVFSESKKGEQSMDPAAQRQQEYMRAKRFCDTPPPPGDNKCSTLSKQIDHAKEVIQLYQDWDSKWQSGRHSDKIDDWKRRLENLKKDHKDNCSNKCP
jgi:RHS repeat-associated protein